MTGEQRGLGTFWEPSHQKGENTAMVPSSNDINVRKKVSRGERRRSRTVIITELGESSEEMEREKMKRERGGRESSREMERKNMKRERGERERAVERWREKR